MLYFSLAFFSLTFFPGLSSLLVLAKLLGCSGFLVLSQPKRIPGFRLPQAFFLLWLAWAFLSCLGSENPFTAFLGSPLRYEGFLTWALATLFALIYWRLSDDWKFINFFSLLTILGMTYIQLTHRSGYASEIIIGTDDNIAAFVAIAGCLLFASRASWTILLVLPCLFLTQKRAGFFALLAGCLFIMTLFSSWRAYRKAFVVGGLLLAIVLPFTHFGHRLASLNPGTMGAGARAQWIVDASKLAHSLPLTGFGLDSLRGQVRIPDGKTVEYHNGIDVIYMSDQCHNVLFETLLQTGWIGLTLGLLALGAALATTIKFPYGRNVGCMAGIIAYLVFASINPAGILAMFMMLICLFGISEKEVL